MWMTKPCFFYKWVWRIMIISITNREKYLYLKITISKTIHDNIYFFIHVTWKKYLFIFRCFATKRILTLKLRSLLQKPSATGNVAGLTDSSKYTGSHKQRFDETGKGRGKAGRTEEKNTSGYVGSYKGEGTFESPQKWCGGRSSFF